MLATVSLQRGELEDEFLQTLALFRCRRPLDNFLLLRTNRQTLHNKEAILLLTRPSRPPAKSVFNVLGLAFICVGLLWSIAYPGDQDDARLTARLLAILFDSGRVAVGLNQELINDPTKGEKHFDPEVFERQVLAAFEQRAGVNFLSEQAELPAMARPLLTRLLEESKKTIASYQPVINVPGIRYKGLIPATFGTETASRFQNWSGIYLRQIAPAHLLRNAKNKPDEYESVMLKALADKANPVDGAPIMEVADAGQTLRLIMPLYYGKACLACHGEPKGERDITGYPREGAKEGDLGGAISVKLPLKPQR